MKKNENGSSVDNKIFISDDDLRLFFEDKYTFGYEDEQTKTFDDEIHYNYDELVKFYGFKMHFANNGKGRFDGWNYVIGTHPPKRSALSINITLAFGTFTPTSITVVATIICALPCTKLFIFDSRSSAFCLPCTIAI